MKLESLHIYKNFGDNHFQARVEFSGSHGKIELSLDERLSDKIIAVCADEIIASSKEVAEAMTANFIESQLAPVIEHQDGAEQTS